MSSYDFFVFVTFPALGPRHKYTGKFAAVNEAFILQSVPLPSMVGPNFGYVINGYSTKTHALDWTVVLQVIANPISGLVAYTVSFTDSRGYHNSKHRTWISPAKFAEHVTFDMYLAATGRVEVGPLSTFTFEVINNA